MSGGARENEPWHVRMETGAYDPVLGDSYNNVGRAGLSLQRSQTSGRLNLTTGPAPVFYTRVDDGAASAKESSVFDGLDTSLAGAYRLLGLTAPSGAVDRLTAIATTGACGARRVHVDGPIGRGAGARPRPRGGPSSAGDPRASPTSPTCST